jgi:hypothetical protein
MTHNTTAPRSHRTIWLKRNTSVSCSSALIKSPCTPSRARLVIRTIASYNSSAAPAHEPRFNRTPPIQSTYLPSQDCALTASRGLAPMELQRPCFCQVRRTMDRRCEHTATRPPLASSTVNTRSAVQPASLSRQNPANHPRIERTKERERGPQGSVFCRRVCLYVLREAIMLAWIPRLHRIRA